MHLGIIQTNSVQHSQILTFLLPCIFKVLFKYNQQDETMYNVVWLTYKYTQEHNKSGIYKLTCNKCKLSYIGQTSRI